MASAVGCCTSGLGSLPNLTSTSSLQSQVHGRILAADLLLTLYGYLALAKSLGV